MKRARHECRYPGCHELTTDRYCEKHKVSKIIQDYLHMLEDIPLNGIKLGKYFLRNIQHVNALNARHQAIHWQRM